MHLDCTIYRQALRCIIIVRSKYALHNNTIAAINEVKESHRETYRITPYSIGITCHIACFIISSSKRLILSIHCQHRCHVSNALPWKFTPPSICNNQLYYKVTPRVIVLWLPSHFATTGLHCKMTPHLEMTPNKQCYTSYVENNVWYCFIVFLSLMTTIHVCIAFRFWNPNWTVSLGMAVILKQPVSYQWFQIEHRVFFLYFV